MILRVGAFCLLAFSGGLTGQCGLSTMFFGGFAGTNLLFTDSLVFDPDGSGPLTPRIACTAFDSSAGPGGPTALGVATFDEATGTWTPLGSGVVQGYATNLAVLPSGELVVGGEFTSVGGVACTNIARWTGTTFAPLGAGLQGTVGDLEVAPNGDLVAVVGSSVWRWDGLAWTSLGSVPSSSNRLAFDAAGDILVGGSSGIVRWNGASWQAFAPGMTSVLNLATTPNGQLLAAGWLSGQPIGNQHFAVWNGSLWTPLGGAWGFPFGLSLIADILFLPDGDPVIAGQYMFLAGGLGNGLNRWDGSQWLPLFPAGGSMRSACMAPTGSLYSTLTNSLQRMTSTCPATIADAGNGCPGSGGANRLDVVERAWLGGTFRSHADGLPTTAIAAVVFGFAPFHLPLSSVFAEAPVGCDLLVTPDILQLVFVTGGEVTSSVPIPSQPAILGGVFHHQLNLYEIDLAGTLLQVTASNAVTATVGAF